MSELPSTAALGIEKVEWFAEGGGNLTVRITGRWRRRRPPSSGQPTLVIEAGGRRLRFPAMPEPPSLAGAAPGMWQLSFSVPGWLAPDLGGQTWLQFGTMVVALPQGGPPSTLAPEPVEDGTGLRQARSHESEPRGPESDTRSPESDAERAAAELASRIGALEGDLDQVRASRKELAASIADRDRTRRIAEQRAHAEQALRRDLARQLASSAQEAARAREAMGELAAAEERIRTLEQGLSDAQRRCDEAEQVALAAAAARERAQRGRDERERGERPARLPAVAASAESARLRVEQELLARRAATGARIPSEPGLPAVGARPAPAPVPAPAPAPVPAPALAPVPAAGAWPVPAPPSQPERRPELRTPAVGFDRPPRAAAEDDWAVRLVHTLRRELDVRAKADAGLRARAVDAEARLAARVLIEQRTSAALGELRGELERLRQALERERELRTLAEHRTAAVEQELTGQRARSRDAHEAIGELRGALELLPAPPPEARGVDTEPPAPPPELRAVEPPALPPEVRAAEHELPASDVVADTADSAGRVEPARLSDALTRLRETVAPPDAVPGAGAAPPTPPPTPLREAIGRPSLEPVFRRLVRVDADAAGRLLLELLALPRAVGPRAVAYDLVLGTGRGAICVSIRDCAPTIALQGAARPPGEVDFQVFGDPARIARLLTARGIRRRFGRRVAKVRGRRDRLGALESVLGTALDLRALHAAGVRLDPKTTLELVACMIEPRQTAGERLTISHEDPETGATYLVVGGGRRSEVTRIAPAGASTTTIACPGGDLLAILAGESVPSTELSGDAGALTSVRQWIKRAQSD